MMYFISQNSENKNKNKNKNDKIKYLMSNELIKLMEDVNIKEIAENENLKNKPILLRKSLFLMNNKKVEDSKY